LKKRKIGNEGKERLKKNQGGGADCHWRWKKKLWSTSKNVEKIRKGGVAKKSE